MPAAEHLAEALRRRGRRWGEANAECLSRMRQERAYAHAIERATSGDGGRLLSDTSSYSGSYTSSYSGTYVSTYKRPPNRKRGSGVVALDAYGMPRRSHAAINRAIPPQQQE